MPSKHTMSRKIHCILIDDDPQAMLAMKDIFNKSDLLGESASFEMEKGASMELQTGSINIIK